MSETTMKKTIKKRKSRLNLVDVILIVLVVLALGIFFSYLFFIAGDNIKDVQLSYQIEVEDVGSQLCTDKLNGDKLYTQSGICLGKVSECSEVMTKYNTITHEDDTYYKQTVHYVVVTVIGDAVQHEGEYRIGGYLLEEGMAVQLTSEDFFIDGICTAITEVNNEST